MSEIFLDGSLVEESEPHPQGPTKRKDETGKELYFLLRK